MAWERGYYYRVRKVAGGRVVREYVGRGPLAELIAEDDARRRRERAEGRAAFERERARLAALDALVAALDRHAAAALAEALTAAGYHQHDRGEWRRRRGCGDHRQAATPGAAA